MPTIPVSFFRYLSPPFFFLFLSLCLSYPFVFLFPSLSLSVFSFPFPLLIKSLCLFLSFHLSSLFWFPYSWIVESSDKLPNTQTSPGYWTTQNMRKFFDDYAQKMKFDPLSATNWYNIKRKDVIMEWVRIFL